MTSSTRPAAAAARGGWAGLGLLGAAGVLWGTIGPAVDVVHDRSGLSPLTIGAWRSAAGIAVLLLAVGAARRVGACRALLRDHRREVVLTGSLTAAFQLLFFVAVVSAGVSVTTVVALGSAPVLLLVLGSVRRRRLPGPGEALVVGAALLGLLLVGAGGGTAGTGTHPGWGVLAALGSGAAYALSAEAGGSLTRRGDALVVTTCTTAVVAAALVPVGVLAVVVGDEPWRTADAGSWVLVAYLGVVTMALAYVLLYAGLRSTPSGTAVVATLLEPVTAVLVAVTLLGERLSPAGAVGCLLILGAIASLGRRGEAPQAQ
ncbi:DMT family transporter [Nocardioides scoriae]|uniref:DMT family transporter n=1 Tax=Nocardioides scoriae TaxID=642780 RepID=UPI0018D4428D|nr:DMT family transporter [Nocardioides scoriae]